MEKYIVRINDNVIKKHDEEGQRKIKKTFLAVGGTILALGLAGFISAFIAFIVLFMGFETDKSMTAWVTAIPFIVLVFVGSILTRIGDRLLTIECEGEKREVPSKNHKKSKLERIIERAEAEKLALYGVKEVSASEKENEVISNEKISKVKEKKSVAGEEKNSSKATKISNKTNKEKK